jgi:hypothetical protein
MYPDVNMNFTHRTSIYTFTEFIPFVRYTLRTSHVSQTFKIISDSSGRLASPGPIPVC